jgi:ppGpp synthetase/RelA/SpoT-type nucleotidyltranferase
MSVIEEFLEHYNREFDHFTQTGYIVQKKIENALTKRGIHAIVTSRAKGIDRLRGKLKKRNAKKSYSDVKEIYRDIIDLAGVRIALYFPADKDAVDSLLRELFTEVRKPKTFPEKKTPKPGKRFMGYFATHYLVKVPASSSDSSELRYINTNVEIQVASVLMHAWAEVEHDLEYKPESGNLSEDESAILDEINGLVLSGELALERLQRAIQRRTAKQNIGFNDQFELASFLSQRAARDDWQTKDVGKVDVLLSALQYLGQSTPSGVSKYVEQVALDERDRPIADVLVDKILTSNQRGVSKLPEILAKMISQSSMEMNGSRSEEQLQIGNFLTEWRQVERLVGRLASLPAGRTTASMIYAIEKAALSQELRSDINQMRKIRNEVVHGNEPPPSYVLKDAADFMHRRIIPELRRIQRKSEGHRQSKLTA